MEILHVTYHTKKTQKRKETPNKYLITENKNKKTLGKIYRNQQRGKKHTTHNVAEIKLRKSHNNKENKQSKKKHNTQTHREKKHKCIN